MGQRLRELRLRRGLQQSEVARRLKISPAYLSLIEKGKREAEGIRADADEYTVDVLSNLEAELVKSLTQARNGIARLRVEHPAAPSGPAPKA